MVATGFIVRRDLSQQSGFIGAMGRCIFVDGSDLKATMVKVDLNTPYFVGTVRAPAMASSFFDIIGNVEGARHFNEADESWNGNSTGSGKENVQGQSEKVVSCHSVSIAGDADISLDSLDSPVLC